MNGYRNFLCERLDDTISATEEDIKSNSPILSIYGRGDHFNISDESVLFEIVKLIKGFVDRHPFITSMSYKFKMEEKSLTFNLTVNGDSMNLRYILEGIGSNIQENIAERYPNFSATYDIILIEKESNVTLKVIISENN
jgi:hypothetical protein